MKSGLISNKGSATVFDVPGQDSKRNLSPELPLQPYNPAVTSLVRSMRPAPRNPLYPFSNGLRQPNPSSRPSNSSPTSGILGGNPTLSSVFHFALLLFYFAQMMIPPYFVFWKIWKNHFFQPLLLPTARLCRSPELKCPSHGHTHKDTDWVFSLIWCWQYRIFGIVHTSQRLCTFTILLFFSSVRNSNASKSPFVNKLWPDKWTSPLNNHMFILSYVPHKFFIIQSEKSWTLYPNGTCFLSWLNCSLFKQFIVSVNWSIYNLWNWPKKISRNIFIQCQCFTKGK